MQKKTTEKKIQQKNPVLPENKKQKSIIKPVGLLALFIAAGMVGFLYPYLNEPNIIPVPKRTAPTLRKTVIEKPLLLSEEEDTSLLNDQTEQLSIVQDENTLSKDKLILSQTQTIKELNEKIHRLEIENLNLNEKMAHQEKLTPLTVTLMEEIYSGRPFGTTLNLLLMYDKTNAFALNVKEKLSSYATTGLPTKEELKQSFLSQMDMAKKAYYINPKKASWNQRWMAYFKSLVHVYPQNMNPQETTGIDLLFLARTQVLNDQFEDALKSIQKLPENARRFLDLFTRKTLCYLTGKQIIDAYLKK